MVDERCRTQKQTSAHSRLARLAGGMVLCLTAVVALGQSATPKAAKGYTLSVFANSVVGEYTKPDSIAVYDDHVYIGYGNGNNPAGLDGKSNKIVEYTRDGRKVYTFTVRGHNDGMKINPYTGKLWVLQNEDSYPNLVVIDPETRQQRIYYFASVPSHGGGYDDVAFRGGKVYLSASNPANNPNTSQVIVEAKLAGGQVETTEVFAGNAIATNVLTGQKAALNLQDPDSMTTTPGGDLLLDSQGDSELVVVRAVGSKYQSAQVIPLSSPYGQPQIDDTLFIPPTDGFLLLADTAANVVYKITKPSFVAGAAYSAGVAGTSAAPGFVGRLDLEFGEITPIASGMQSPHGLAFVKTSDEDRLLDKLQDECKVLFGNE